MLSIDTNDLEKTRQSKERIFELVKEWLGIQPQTTETTTHPIDGVFTIPSADETVSNDYPGDPTNPVVDV